MREPELLMGGDRGINFQYINFQGLYTQSKPQISVHFILLSFTATKRGERKKYPTNGTDLFTKIKN
jgi:hypothetical protein